MSWTLGKYWRAGLYGASVVFVGIAAYWAALPDAPRSPPEPPASPSGEIASAGSPYSTSRPRDLTTRRSSSFQAQTALPVDTEEATVAQYSAQKYQLLLDELHTFRADRAELQRALLQREQLTGLQESGQKQQALAAADERIRSMLHPADFATFEALKDSDLELFELEDYAGGVSNVAPLSTEDRKAILRTKLAYKGRFRQLVRDSGLQRQDLSPAEREYAYGVASRALQAYQESYLLEVRQYLSNDEQYTLLSNYESTKFTAELAKLRDQANGS